MHVAAVALITSFLGMGWWQVFRAANGNLRSFGYAVEWPVFAGFVIFVWFREVRSVLAGPAPTDPATPADERPTALSADDPSPDDEPRALLLARRHRLSLREAPTADDQDLDAYNHYLAWLAANPHTPIAHYPGQARTASARVAQE